MARYSDTVTNTRTGGTPYPIVGALIAVSSSSGTTPTLYADDGVTVLANPLTSDEYGVYYFNAPADFYDLKYYYGGREILERAAVAVGTPTLPAGSIADAMGTATNIAPSQRAVADALVDAVAEVAVEAAAATATAEGAVAVAAAAEASVAALQATGWHPVAKSADTSVVSSTVLITDPDLTVFIAANAFVVIRGHINYSASAAGDFKYRLTGPTAVTVQIDRKSFAPGAGAPVETPPDLAYDTADVAVTGGAGSGLVEFVATIHNGGAGGNFLFKWAQNTSDATASIVKAGSYLEVMAFPRPVDFAFANAAIVKLGGFTASSFGGHNDQLSIAGVVNSRLITNAFGSRCDAQLFGGAGDYSVIVDGSAPVTITAPAGWSWVTLFTGLSDAAHRVELGSASTAVSLAYESDALFRVTGSAPAVERPDDLPNQYPLGQAPYSGYIACDGVYALTSHSLPNLQRDWTFGCGFMMRFRATTTSVRLQMFEGATPSAMQLYQDGVAFGAPVTPPNTSNLYQVFTVATGLSGTHEYEIKLLDALGSAYCYELLVDTLEASAHTAKPTIAFFGDSNVAQTYLPNALDGDAYKLAVLAGHAAVRQGQGGQGAVWARDNTVLITGLPQAPAHVICDPGSADIVNGLAVPTFQAAYQQLLVNLRSGLGSAKLHARGILPATSAFFTPTQRTTYNSAMAAAVTATADGNTVYINTDGWIDPTIGVHTIDGVHLNAAGGTAVATQTDAVL